LLWGGGGGREKTETMRKKKEEQKKKKGKIIARCGQYKQNGAKINFREKRAGFISDE
jgi:hypothetical protein